MEFYIFVLDNIHCQSCQESIVRVLAPIIPSDHVLVDIAEKTVTVAVSTRTEDIKNQIIERLYNAGFDVLMVDDHGAVTPSGNSLWDRLWGKRKRTKKHHEHCKSCQDEKQRRKSTTTSLSEEENGSALEGVTIVDSTVENQLYRVIFSIGGMTCAACQNSVSAAVSDQLPEVTEFGVDLLTKSGMAVVDDKRLVNRIQQIIEDVGYDCEVIEIVPLEKQARGPADEHHKLFKVSASVGGMTCASCINAVNEQVKLLPFIKSFNVSLMNNSAEFVITEPKVNVDKIREAIEDAGYEFSVVSVMPVVTVKSQSRTVNLSVTGMFCE
jgi:copper ion binding protein